MSRPDPLMLAIRSAFADAGILAIDLSASTGIPNGTLSVLLRSDAPRDLRTLRHILAVLSGHLAVVPAKPAPRNQLPRLLAELRGLRSMTSISQSTLVRESKVNSKALHRFLDPGSPGPTGIANLAAVASALRLRLSIAATPTNP